MKRNQIICGDCLDVMGTMPNESVDAIITDPPWPNCKVDTGWQGEEWWARIVAEMERLVGTKGKIIIHLNSQTHPAPFIMPFTLPFVHLCWLRYAVPRYRGNILNCGDVAYQFGRGYLPKGRRVLSEETRAASKGKAEISWHPCPRNSSHVSWLVFTQVGPSRLILDPFAGSGTTLIAAKINGCEYIGIEIDPEYARLTKKRIEEMPPRMF